MNKIYIGDCRELIDTLNDESVDVVVTSPPYWGQRTSPGVGVEDDPRDYLDELIAIFRKILPKLKSDGIMWVNLGDAYNTPVNWRLDDRKYSSLGVEKNGLDPNNSAYTKPRAKRRAFIDDQQNWLSYGNLLGLTYRLVIGLVDAGYLFRGEVIWKKKNPMPEGRARRPHRQHEGIYLFAKTERHRFRISPPVPSVWEFSSEHVKGLKHFSRFPEELPRRGIEAIGELGKNIVVLDPFAGTGTTCVAAKKLGCSYIGFELDPDHAAFAEARLLEPLQARL